MHVEYEVLSEDVIAWNVHLMQVSPRLWRQWLKRRILFICIPLIIWLWTFSLAGNSLSVVLLSILAFSALMVALCGFFMSKTIIAFHTKRHVQNGYATALGHHSVELMPDILHSKSRFGEGSTYWSAIQRIDATEHHLFFFIDDSHAILIPKRSFPDPSQSQAFLHCAQQYHAAAHLRQA